MFDAELLVPFFAVAFGKIRVRLELSVEVVEITSVVAARDVALFGEQLENAPRRLLDQL